MGFFIGFIVIFWNVYMVVGVDILIRFFFLKDIIVIKGGMVCF